jgi:NAD(P)-dependent dehydrogenase (short-subunit alcohol dehydrogenase family)
MRLEGKNVLVTGASRGIGKAIVERFTAEGARVLPSSRTAGFPADLTREDDVRKLVDHAFRELGQLHILVNNAGVYPVTPFQDISMEEWRAVMAINLDGPFLCSRLAAEQMIARGTRGRILNVSSTASLVARPGIAHYASSKAGLNTLTRVLAIELAPHGITVNALCPGVIETETVMAQSQTAEHEVKLRRIPLGRLGTPEEVAAAALFMVSDEAAYLTGACLVLDGGYSLGIPAY